MHGDTGPPQFMIGIARSLAPIRQPAAMGEGNLAKKEALSLHEAAEE